MQGKICGYGNGRLLAHLYIQRNGLKNGPQITIHITTMMSTRLAHNNDSLKPFTPLAMEIGLHFYQKIYLRREYRSVAALKKPPKALPVVQYVPQILARR